jgi:branched-chain amino acid transport system permease protein
MWGAIIGGAMVAWMPERFRGFADKRVFVFGVALVLVMVFRPQGLIPRKIRVDRWLASLKPGSQRSGAKDASATTSEAGNV